MARIQIDTLFSVGDICTAKQKKKDGYGTGQAESWKVIFEALRECQVLGTHSSQTYTTQGKTPKIFSTRFRVSS